MTEPPLFELRDIAKSFLNVRALDSVGFDVRAGEIHALLGENGAGKSTLVKIMSGIYRPDRGTIAIAGQPVAFTSPTHAQQLGIVPVHQELHLQPWLTVAENIFLGRQPLDRWGLVDRRRMNADATALMARLGVLLEATATVENLSVAQRQIIVIARAMTASARVVILDEPTSSLTDRETTLLFDMITGLRVRGLGIAYISHRLEEIARLCDRVTVLRDGRHVATRPVLGVSTGDLIGMMIGRPFVPASSTPPRRSDRPVLAVRNLNRRGLLADVSFEVKQGEIVGLAGLVGAGRTELARAVFGDLAIDGGSIVVDGRTLRRRHGPKDAIGAGIGLVPEDRKEQGLVTGLSIRDNISMAVMRSITRIGVVSRKRETALAERYIARLSIKTPSASQKAMFLSGGNQQRVVIAKWLATKPRILIVDEPTRGVDVGASAEIHAILRELAADGLSVLMISSDLTEVLSVSHRVLVMHQGRIVGEVAGDTMTQHNIMRLATGQSGNCAA